MATDTARNRMVDAQIARRGIKDARVLAAMRAVPRENFTAPGFEEFAYEDSALPIAEGQTISQPYIVGAMLAGAELEPGDKLLEVGAGSGYAAAVASRIAGQVLAIERHAALTEAATQRLAALGYTNVTLKTGDGSRGWPEEAPFDAIIVSAGGPSVPETLKQQLAIGGRLVIPVGPADEQRLIRLTRTGEESFEQDDLGAVRFVKLIGAGGWYGGLGKTENGGAPRPQPSQADRTGGRTPARFRQPGLWGPVRPLWPEARGASGRSQPRHFRILSSP
jgi:protein-L-isoaspartate(D-aspartate) O-methyltransferase